MADGKEIADLPLLTRYKEKLVSALVSANLTSCGEYRQNISPLALSAENGQESIDEFILHTEQKAKACSEHFNEVKEIVGNRMKEALDPEKAIPAESMNWASSNLNKLGEEAYRLYTRKSLATLTEHAASLADDDTDLLRDSIYPSTSEYKYYDHLEKKRRKQGNPTDKLLCSGAMHKKHAHNKKSSSHTIGTRSRNRAILTTGLHLEDTEGTGPDSKSSQRKIFQCVKKRDKLTACQVCNETRDEARNRIVTCSVRVE